LIFRFYVCKKIEILKWLIFYSNIEDYFLSQTQPARVTDPDVDEDSQLAFKKLALAPETEEYVVTEVLPP
jgi:hypothetical protein